MYSGMWKTSDGRIYKIEEMDTRHIKNCIRLIRRKWPLFRPGYLERLELELYIRSLK